ncbi:MAG: sigma-70 family RNA polymerase sigma factor [Planctomycetes bacterium]|nr:sigma-70 family RNA polymerase sigma factor [Planctomycetota bacterium]
MGSAAPKASAIDGRDLMQAVSAGEPGAFERLVVAYEPRIKAAVARHVSDRSSVDDLSQEILLRLWRARDRYEPTARFETFLYRIIFNICVNHTQHSRRRRHPGFRQGSEDDEPGVPLPADESALPAPRELELFERAQLLHAAIGRLPDSQRRALLLARFEGLAYEEIASVMDTSLQAVKSLLWRARENLRAVLAARLDEVDERDAREGSDDERA